MRLKLQHHFVQITTEQSWKPTDLAIELAVIIIAQILWWCARTMIVPHHLRPGTKIGDLFLIIAQEFLSLV